MEKESIGTIPAFKGRNINVWRPTIRVEARFFKEQARLKANQDDPEVMADCMINIVADLTDQPKEWLEGCTLAEMNSLFEKIMAARDAFQSKEGGPATAEPATAQPQALTPPQKPDETN